METKVQEQFLKQAGCKQFQGFLLAPALPVGDFESRVDPDGRDKLRSMSDPAR